MGGSWIGCSRKGSVIILMGFLFTDSYGGFSGSFVRDFVMDFWSLLSEIQKPPFIDVL